MLPDSFFSTVLQNVEDSYLPFNGLLGLKYANAVLYACENCKLAARLLRSPGLRFSIKGTDWGIMKDILTWLNCFARIGRRARC